MRKKLHLKVVFDNREVLAAFFRDFADQLERGCIHTNARGFDENGTDFDYDCVESDDLDSNDDAKKDVAP